MNRITVTKHPSQVRLERDMLCDALQELIAAVGAETAPPLPANAQAAYDRARKVLREIGE